MHIASWLALELDYARLGEIETRCGGSDNPDVQEVGANAGIGLDWRLAERTHLRVSWDRYFGVGKTVGRNVVPADDARGKFDIDLFAVGVVFSF